MTTRLLKRRPDALRDDPTESGLDQRTILSSNYSTSSSFLAPVPALLSPEQPNHFVFQGAPIPPNAFEFALPYTQQLHDFEGSSQHYPHHHHQTELAEDHSDEGNTSRKRPKLEIETMPCLPFFFSNGDDEKSPEHDYVGDETCTFAAWTPFGGTYATRSDCGPSPSYQPISTEDREMAVAHAYSVDLHSGPGMPQPLHLSTHGTGQSQPGAPNLMDSGDVALFTERQHPVLQPMPHPSMCYPPQAPMYGPSSGTHQPELKMEEPHQDFQVHDLHLSPIYMQQMHTPHLAPSMTPQDSGSYHLDPTERYTTQYPAPHEYMSTSTLQPCNFSLEPEEGEGSGKGKVQSQKPPPTRRGPFKDNEKRRETAATRKMGSCIRCRMQRIRCETDSPDDENAPCSCCVKIASNTKVHRMPCKRWKLVDVRLSKPGNVEVEALRWTHRWKDTTALPEITQHEWQDSSSEKRVVILVDGLLDSGVRVEVRRFKPLEVDQVKRTWYEGGRKKEIKTSNYALVNVASVKAAYEEHLSDIHSQMLTKDDEKYRHQPQAQRATFKELLGNREDLVWRTYRHARARRDDQGTEIEERDLLTKVLDLWVAVRLTTRSFWIAGNEDLGIPRDSRGRILLPPVMGRQLDKMLLDHTLTKLRRETLDALQKMTQSKKQKTWMTTYLVSFMLLHNVSLITDHDMKYAKKHTLEFSQDQNKMLIWARPEMVQQYHLGANIVLAYFHYCNRGTYPFSDECKESDLKNLAELKGESIDLVRWTREQVNNKINKDKWEHLRNTGYDRSSTDEGAAERRAEAYCDPYFFVSQLYEPNWTPRDSLVTRTCCRKTGPVLPNGRFSM